jgi:hypothetical protein
VTGGVQPPCTLKRFPHKEAHAGSVENGTMRPLGEATAAAGPVWLRADARERRLPASTRSDMTRIVLPIFASRRPSRRESSCRYSPIGTALYYRLHFSALAYIEYIAK